MSEVEDPAERLARITDLTTLALEGKETGDPAFNALGVVARECAIPHTYIYDLIEGFALDASGWHPRTEQDLMVDAMRDARLVVVTESGHLSTVEAPEQVADALVTFLADVKRLPQST